MLRLSPPTPPLAPLPILYTKCGAKYSTPMYPHHISRSCSLSDDAKRGIFLFFIKLSLLAPFGTALLGLSHTRATGYRPRCWTWAASEVVQRMIIAGFPSHANGPGQTSGNYHSSCYPLSIDRDNHSCPSPGYHCTLPSCPSVLHLHAGARWQ